MARSIRLLPGVQSRVNKKKAVAIAVVAAVLGTLVVVNLSLGRKKIEHEITTDYGVADPQFRRTMTSLLGPSLVGGNRVTEFLNGDKIFPAMLAAIHGAQKTIDFETYIYWEGSIGHEFSQALADRAQAGVQVHVTLDWAGTKIDPKYVDQMKAAGVAVETYHTPHWYTLSRLNNRTHRKILVVDGRVGFTGGVGIGDEWRGDAETPDHWRDTHFRLEGPAVAQMQAAFMDNWMQVHGEVYVDADYFPELAPKGEALAQVFNSSPRGGGDKVRMMYMLSIAAARKSILISNAYFVPDDLCIRTLVAARKRGVRIELITPGPTDAKVTKSASRSRWGELIEAGVEFYVFQPTLYHCKVMIVDESWVSVGSTNFDNRSFELNDETNLDVYDSEFAKRQVQVFEDDKRRSHRVTIEEWRARPWHERLAEHVSGLVRSQL